MATVRIWQNGAIQCRLLIEGPAFTLQLLSGNTVFQQQIVMTPDVGFELAREWERTWPLIKLQAALSSLERAMNH
jgi:hypothetical protein